MNVNFACRLCGFCFGLEGVDSATMGMSWGLMESHLNTHTPEQVELFIQCNGTYEMVDEDPAPEGPVPEGGDDT